MKFKSIGKIENPSPGQDDSDYYSGKFHDKLEKLQKQSDFVIVTVLDD